MKKFQFATALLGIVGLIMTAPAQAGINVDFQAELQWRADYHDDLDAAVILYEYSHYRGRQLVLYPDEQLEDFYDYQWGFRVRSVRVIGPVHVVLFDESGLWGHQLEVYHDIPDLGDYRMRLNTYSTFRWHRRARSAYVSFNPVGVEFRIELGRRILPRIYCAYPIAPRYYRPAPSYRYHNPRPRYYDNRPYRNNTHTRPYVTPPAPRAQPPGNRQDRPPTARPNYSPGRPPNAVPSQRPGSIKTPNPGQSRPPAGERPRTERPSGKPNQQVGKPPTTRPPTQVRPGNPPSRPPSGKAPGRTPPSTQRTAPPSTPPSTVPSRSGKPPSVAIPSRSRPSTAAPPRVTRQSRPPSAAPSRQRPRSAPPPPPRRN